MLEDGSAPSDLNTTAWSVIIGAQHGGAEGRRCLEQLMRTYWKPAYYYARRRGMNHHDAADCVQEFFARMLAGDWLAKVDRQRGHFRGWLLTALRRWVSRARTATGIDRITLVNDEVVRTYEQEDADSRPEDLFNRAWARSSFDEALRLFREEQVDGARARQVQVFLAYLEAAAGEGPTPSYEELAERFDVPVTTITNDLHRARALFHTYLLRVVRETVGDPADAEAELQQIRRYL